MYILLRVHYIPVKLHRTGRLIDPLCGKCRRTFRDLIHLLWRCTKLERYWSTILSTLNRVFQVTVSLSPVHCLLGILEEVVPEDDQSGLL